MKLMQSGKAPRKSFLEGDLLCLLLLLALSLFVCWPFLKDNFITTVDGGDHLLRLFAMQSFIGKDQWFVRWVPYLHGYGYPEFNFYPPLVAMVGTVLVKAGLSLVWSLNLTCVLFIFLTGLTMYILAKEFWGRQGACLSAVAYLFAPYLMVDYYARGDYSEAASFAFLPLIFWAFLKLYQEQKVFYLVIGGLSIAGLFLVNNCVTLIFFPIILLYIFLLYFSTGRRHLPLLISLATFALGMGLAAFFWLPAFLEKNLVHIDRMLQGGLDFHHNFLSLKELIFAPWPQKPGTRLPYEIGFVHALFAITGVCFIKKISREQKHLGHQMLFFTFIFIGAVFMALPASLWIWDHVHILKFLQFQSRLLIVLTFTVSILAGSVALIVHPKYRWPVVSLGILIIFAVNYSHCFPPYGSAKVNLPSNVPPAFVFRQLHAQDGGEFIPKWVQMLREPVPLESLDILSGNGQILDRQQHFELHQSFTVQATSPLLLCFNSFYFPGWTVKVDGQPVDILKDNPLGLIIFTFKEGVHGVKVDFGQTPVHQAATVISLICLLILLFESTKALLMSRPGLVKAFQAVFACFLVYFAVLLFHYHYYLISFPYPIIYREAPVMATTYLLLHGANPYNFVFEPQYSNLYGIVYPLIALPWVKLFGQSLIVYRAITAFFILASCVVIFLVLHKKKTPFLLGCWAVLALYASLLYPLTSTPCVDPASMGLFFMLLTIFIPFLFDYSLASLVTSLVCGLLAFYTKPYFFLGLPVLASYLFFFVSRRKAVLFGCVCLGALLLSMFVMNYFFPSYFDDCFFVNYNHSADVSMMIVLKRQLHQFADLHKGIILLLMFSAFFALKDIKGMFKKGAPCLPLHIYAGICFAAVLLFSMGRHLGANLWYFFQLFSPFLVIAVAWLAGRLRLWMIPFSFLLVYNLFLLTSDDHYKYFDKGNTKGWKTVETLIRSRSQIFHSSLISPLLIQQNKVIYDDGTDHFSQGGERHGWVGRFLKEDNRVTEAQATLVAKVKMMMQADAFDLVILEAGYASDVMTNDMIKKYRYIGQMIVNSPQDRKFFILKIWVPYDH